MSTESETSSLETPEKKSAAGLGFLTILLFLVAAALLATPFLWGLKELKTVTPDPSVLNEWTQWAGDMHLIVLHIPIGIFVYVLVMEILGLLSFRKFKPNLSGALFLTVLSTILAIATGYLYFLKGDHGPAPFNDFDNAMGMHMWAILLFGVFVIFSFISKAWSRRNEKGSVFYPLFMLISAAALGFGAHQGGALVHGKAKADAMITDPLVLLGYLEEEVVAVVEQELDVSDVAPEDRLAFEQVVKPVLVGKCWECHAGPGINPVFPQKGKVKAKLLMTTVEELIKGGKNNADFPNLIPGDADESEMIVRVELDKDDDEFMPKGKEDEPHLHFTEGEIRVIRWWIDNLDAENLSDRPVKEVPGYEDVLADIAAIEPVIREALAEKDEDQPAEEVKEEEVVVSPEVPAEESEPAVEESVTVEEMIEAAEPEPAPPVVEEVVEEKVEEKVEAEMPVAPAKEIEPAAEEPLTAEEIVEQAMSEQAAEEADAIEEAAPPVEEVAEEISEEVAESVEEVKEAGQEATESAEDKARKALEELKKMTEGN